MRIALNKKQLFPLGQIVATPGSLSALERNKQNAGEFISRHRLGDWGNLCETDREENENALQNGERILSSYRLEDGEKIWIITEADRSATTLLRPEEY